MVCLPFSFILFENIIWTTHLTAKNILHGVLYMICYVLMMLCVEGDCKRRATVYCFVWPWSGDV